MKRIGSFVSFVASCVTAAFVITVAVLVATGVGIDGGSLLDYDEENEMLTFLGESIPLESETVEGVLGYPERAAEFVAEFLPDAVRIGLDYAKNAVFEGGETTLKESGTPKEKDTVQ